MKPIQKSDYKKTYKPLLGWIFILIVGSIGIPMFLQRIGGFSADLITKVTLFTTVGFIQLLMYIIYKGEYVYWINGGPSYEEAKKAGSEKRKEYARAHLKIFSTMTKGCALYSLLSYLLALQIELDILIITGAIVVAAFKTMDVTF